MLVDSQDDGLAVSPKIKPDPFLVLEAGGSIKTVAVSLDKRRLCLRVSDVN